MVGLFIDVVEVEVEVEKYFIEQQLFDENSVLLLDSDDADDVENYKKTDVIDEILISEKKLLIDEVEVEHIVVFD